jgi:hypothetical protein
MYSMTTLEGTLLALAMVTAATLLVLGALVFFPRALQAVTVGVQCPLIGRRATAELARDEWTRRLVDVTSCSVLGTPGVSLCRKGCLPAAARAWRVSRG